MEYLNKLNAEQLKAVTTKSKKVLVIAGAGSGKTKVLTERIKYLLDNSINKNEIVAFTFTKRAAKEMEYRLQNYNFNNIYTFHSFCYSILKDYKDELGFNKFDSIRLVTEDYELKLIEDILSEINVTFNPRIIKDYISKRKNELPFQFKDTHQQAFLNKIYFLFQEKMIQKGMIDFDDMISIILNNLDNLRFKEDILDSCKYILVDECQDTNQIQYNLINKLASKHNNIFMVGDEDQLIYSFRSSDIEILNQFKSECDEIIILNQNYRSSTNILELANNLISNNHFRENKNLYSLIPKKYEIKYDDYSDTSQQAIFISNKIDLLIKKGIKPNDIAVLFRNNYQSNEIEYYLAKRNIPFTTYGKRKFFDYDETKRIILFYQYLEDPNDYILFNEIFPIDLAYSKQLINNYKTSNKQFLDYLIESPYVKLKEYALKIKKVYDNKLSYTKERLFDLIVLTLFDINQIKNKEHIIALKDLIIHNELEHEIDIINELMLSDVSKKELGVNLLTIHKAKGLEFKCVFIISINNGIIPSSLKYDKDIEEERRLLYVAITRAKEYLYLSSAEYHIINGQRKRLRPSIFIGEIE